MSKTIKNIVKWGITAVVVVVSVYLSMREIDFQAFVKEIQSANLWIALLPIPIMLLSHWLRAIRWRTILRPVMEVNSLTNMFSAIMVGYFFNNVMPRGGEIMRPYVYAKREKKSFSTIFSTIVIERLLDVLTLLFLFALALLISKETIMSAMPEEQNWNSFIYILVGGILVVAVCLYPPVMNMLLEKLVKPISYKFYEKLSEIFGKFKQGFRIIQTPSMYARVGLESLGIWACYAIPMYIHFYCFSFSADIHLGITDALFLLVVSGIGVSIAPTPGGVGVFHLVVGTAIMTLYGLTKEQAMAYATVNHFINMMFQIVVGLAFFLRERVVKMPQVDENGELETLTNE